MRISQWVFVDTFLKSDYQFGLYWLANNNKCSALPFKVIWQYFLHFSVTDSSWVILHCCSSPTLHTLQIVAAVVEASWQLSHTQTHILNHLPRVQAYNAQRQKKKFPVTFVAASFWARDIAGVVWSALLLLCAYYDWLSFGETTICRLLRQKSNVDTKKIFRLKRRRAEMSVSSRKQQSNGSLQNCVAH